MGLSPLSSLLLGSVLASLLVLAEIRLRTVSLKRLLGAALGFLLGLLASLLVAVVLKLALPASGASLAFLQIIILIALPFLGLQIGSSKGELLDLSALGGLIGGEKSTQAAYKILDTSVIIDGRVAEILETGFLDGTIVIPQFVLRELQMVADSSDSLKRNRGRRGLDILQRLQKSPKVTVQIVEQDFPQIREVDLKLIELAKLFSSKIVTNDFNLNKVAQLQGVQVLNINELANSLRPVVLPGEIMRVFIVKEGKEASQGVAYLDDGTMVVVDNARKMISKTIDIAVTSVLQTTAGKMIFGRFDDRLHAVHEAKQEKAG
ncbi:MAG: PIN domain-containing protein [Bryobacter sp.]|nr:PIN domain-containing protein [Bryobacter sp.]